MYLILRDFGHRFAAESSMPIKTTAEVILDERYARGELTREVYQHVKEDLNKATI